MEKYLSKLISKSRKQVTILFTDIEGSTKLWESKGDIKGRLMLDQHNRLIFPVIHKFQGKIIKTIGDSVMASFKSPKNAIRAAIGIQQSIKQYKQTNKKFKLKIRIGLHTGKAIVEKDDVFGDVVNVAARVESIGKGGDIMISARTANLVKHKEFLLNKKGSFLPKGKKRAITVYRSDWLKLPSLISKINFDSTLPILARNKMELFIYSLASVGILYFIFHHYIRYYIADHKLTFILNFNPQYLLSEHLIVLTLLISSIIATAILIRLSYIPFFLYRFVKGGFGFSALFLLTLFVSENLTKTISGNFHSVISESKHLFVEVVEEKVNIHMAPSTSSSTIMHKKSGDLLLLTDVKKVNDVIWNKVLIADDKHGWVPRILPAEIGVPERRYTIAYKSYLKWKDIYALILGFIGFILGYYNFKIRPS